MKNLQSSIINFQSSIILISLVTVLSALTTAQGQSIWLESGLGYIEIKEEDRFRIDFKFGVRGVYPINDQLGVYAAFGVQQDVSADAGVWLEFPRSAGDVQNLRADAGVGVTFIDNRYGLALTGALRYELSQSLDLALVYTHRPLFFPDLSQAFDVSLGLRVDLREVFR